MATEIITHLGDLEEFDPFLQKMKEDYASQSPHHSELLTSSALSSIGLKFEGENYEVAKASDPNSTPFKTYSELASKASLMMKEVESIIEDEISKIQQSLPAENFDSEANSSIKKLTSKIKALEANISKYDQEEEVAYSEVAELQKSLNEKKREIFEAKEKEYDEEISEIRALDEEYKTYLAQDENLLNKNILADLAISIADQLKAIIEKYGDDVASMQAEFSPKLNELYNELEMGNFERFFDEVQGIILLHLRGIIDGSSAEIDRQAVINEIEGLVAQDYEAASSYIRDRDVEREVNAILLEKEILLDQGPNKVINEEIQRIQEEINGLESIIDPAARVAMVKEKDAATQKLSKLQTELQANSEKLEAGLELIQKLNDFGINSIVNKMNHMDFDDVEISDLDTASIVQTESLNIRQSLVQLRGQVALSLKDVNLYADDAEIKETSRLIDQAGSHEKELLKLLKSKYEEALAVSLEIAAASDLDGFITLKSNYLSEKSRNIIRSSHMESQINRVNASLTNIETLTNYLENTEKLASQTGINHEKLGEVAKLKEALLESAKALKIKGQELEQINEGYLDKSDGADKRIELLDKEIDKFYSKKPYSSAKDLKSNYNIHISILNSMQGLVHSFDELEEEIEELKAAINREIETDPIDEFDIDNEYEEIDGDGDSLEGIFGDDDEPDLDTSLFDELEEAKELNASIKKPEKTIPLPESSGAPVADKVNTSTTKPVSGGGDAASIPLPKPVGFDVGSTVKTKIEAAKPAEAKAITLPVSSGAPVADTLKTSTIKPVFGGGDAASISLPKPVGFDVGSPAKTKIEAAKPAEAKAIALPVSSGAPVADTLKTSTTKPVSGGGDAASISLPKPVGFDVGSPAKTKIEAAKPAEAKAIDLPVSSGAPVADTLKTSTIKPVFGGGDAASISLPKPVGFDVGSPAKTKIEAAKPAEAKAIPLPKPAGMDFTSVMNMLGAGSASASDAMGSADKVSASVKSSSHRIVGDSALHNASMNESGTLPIDDGDKHVRSAHVEHRGYVPKHSDAGPSLADKDYKLIATALTKGQSSHAKAEKPQSEVNAKPIKPSKTAEIVQKMRVMQAGQEDKKLGPSLSNYDPDVLKRLYANGYKPGERLLWAMRKHLAEAGLADLLNHVQN